jgi:chemotaxis signal transduction protein
MMASDAEQIERFLGYMPDVLQCASAFNEVNAIWRQIDVAARIASPQEARAILPMLESTRSAFDRLQESLMGNLVNEKITSVLAEQASRSRMAIDVITRNLYERTADVGFLATDDVLCRIAAGLDQDLDAAQTRLRSYRDKYTVYSEVLIADINGALLVRTDESFPVSATVDPLVAQALQSEAYVEVFRDWDARPVGHPSLIYAHRMLHPQTRQPVGVLCLVFDFFAEMKGIFADHTDSSGYSIAMLIDAQHRVTSSSDPQWIAPGAEVPVQPSPSDKPVLFAGREYLVQTVQPPGYQGYPGPEGWMCQVMTPLDLAFRSRRSHVLDQLPPDIANGLMVLAKSFSQPLRDVISATNSIRQVVWNGQVVSVSDANNEARLKPILSQVSEAGALSGRLSSKWVRDLYESVLNTSQHQLEYSAHLAVDLFDRNLYERANDCRWWALTPEFREGLASGEAARFGQILKHIHSLYTVYSRLFIFNRDGAIVAESKDAEGLSLIGESISSTALRRVLHLTSEQDYWVSPFESGPLTDGLPTYIYYAAIRHPQLDTEVLGGIGIVFHAQREFQAMLRSIVGPEGRLQACFVSRQGQLIASSDDALSAQTVLALAGPRLKLDNGVTQHGILEHEGQYMATAVSANACYREFKTVDGYRDDVLAVVFKPLGPIVHHAYDDGHNRHASWSRSPGKSGRKFATFYVDRQLIALEATCVREGIPAQQMTNSPSGSDSAKVGIIPPTPNSGTGKFIWVYDLHQLIHGTPHRNRNTDHKFVVILQAGSQTIGLLVDELYAVPEIADEEIIEAPGGHDSLSIVDRLIRAHQGESLIGVIHLHRLLSKCAALRPSAASMSV